MVALPVDLTLASSGYSTEQLTSFVATESNAKTFNTFRAVTEDSTISNPKVKAATLVRQTTNKVLFDLPASPVSSNNPLVEALNYDTTNAVQEKNLQQTKTSVRQTSQVLGESVAILQGKRDGAPQFLQSTY